MADPNDPRSAASTFAGDQPGRGVVSDDAAAKRGGVKKGYETSSEATANDVGKEAVPRTTNDGQAYPPGHDPSVVPADPSVDAERVADVAQELAPKGTQDDDTPDSDTRETKEAEGKPSTSKTSSSSKTSGSSKS